MTAHRGHASRQLPCPGEPVATRRAKRGACYTVPNLSIHARCAGPHSPPMPPTRAIQRTTCTPPTSLHVVASAHPLKLQLPELALNWLSFGSTFIRDAPPAPCRAETSSWHLPPAARSRTSASLSLNVAPLHHRRLLYGRLLARQTGVVWRTITCTTTLRRLQFTLSTGLETGQTGGAGVRFHFLLAKLDAFLLATVHLFITAGQLSRDVASPARRCVLQEAPMQ